MYTKQWVENWKCVAQLLEQVEKERLQSPDYHDELKLLSPLFDWVCAHAELRKSSGLVEQQPMAMLEKTLSKKC
jgi:hypothetical protein